MSRLDNINNDMTFEEMLDQSFKSTYNGEKVTGVVTGITFKGVHYEMIVDVDGFKWMIQSTDMEPVGKTIGLHIEPDAFHIMKRSEYSGMFGDYSTFSDEMDEEQPEEEVES